ncbi:borealin-2 [Takifugu rubripes]|uniref:borealin-2 n=1 Tax=Takifugu rubripes TaxID=31033 RepID=UPI001145F878|nr:borealin-2-like [Takifugu rubripes]
MPVDKRGEAGRSQNQEQLNRGRLALFLQQVEKEAEERMNELEAKMENMLVTIDKAFKVEMMKMPPSLLNTRIGDLISEEDLFSRPEASITLKNESELVPPSLRRVPSRRGDAQASTSSSSTPPQQVVGKDLQGRAAKTLAASSSTGKLSRSLSATSKRSQSRTPKTAEPIKPKLRSVVSTGDLHCTVAASAAHISITTAQGQTVTFSGETKGDLINLDALDDVTWRQINKLTVSISPSMLR